MTNLFKKAAALFGNWTGIKRTATQETSENFSDPMAEVMTEQSLDAPVSSTEFLPLDGPGRDWNDSAQQAPALDSEAAIATGEISATPLVDAPVAPDQAVAACDSVVVPLATTATPAPVVEETKAPIEMKPSGMNPKPSVTFTQLYELISTEVNKRTDNAITVYERLLAASREELKATRRSNRIAWSIGGVMTAVAAFGAIWSAGEVAATHVEVGSLKQQVVAGQQASIERDQLRTDLMKVREASAKVEIDALKARLDQALVMTSDRTRLRNDLESVRKAKQDLEVELKVARGAATQPISEALPASGKVQADKSADRVAGAERRDAWSILLNGADDR
jgi:hypothetical protein